MLAGSRAIPQRSAGARGGDNPQHSGDIPGGSCAAGGAPQAAAGLLLPGALPGASAAGALFHHSPGPFTMPPASSPSCRPSHPACWIPSSLLTPWGKAGRCNHRQPARESRREGRRKPITGRSRKVVEGEGRGHSSIGGTADYFAWIVEEKRELHL